jgi:hypothetical protein
MTDAKTNVLQFPNGKAPDESARRAASVHFLNDDWHKKESAAVTFARAMKDVEPDEHVLIIRRKKGGSHTHFTCSEWDVETLAYMIEAARSWLRDNKG